VYGLLQSFGFVDYGTRTLLKHVHLSSDVLMVDLQTMFLVIILA
jgi:hypothetical protein